MQHVPYDSRNREVVYIMDSNRANPVGPTRSNGFGIAGFVLSLLGFFTCGVLSPLGLLFSVLGMFRAPRGLATAGTVMGLMGTGMIAGLVALSTEEHHAHYDSAVVYYEQQQTDESIKEAKQVIEQYRYEHDGEAPEGIEGNKIVLMIEDGWRTGLGYEVDDRGYTIRSAGPDQEFDTDDDITSRVAWMGENEDIADADSIIGEWPGESADRAETSDSVESQ